MLVPFLVAKESANLLPNRPEINANVIPQATFDQGDRHQAFRPDANNVAELRFCPIFSGTGFQTPEARKGFEVSLHHGEANFVGEMFFHIQHDPGREVEAQEALATDLLDPDASLWVAQPFTASQVRDELGQRFVVGQNLPDFIQRSGNLDVGGDLSLPSIDAMAFDLHRLQKCRINNYLTVEGVFLQGDTLG